MSGLIEQAELLRAKVESALGDLVDLVTLDGQGVKPQTRAAVVVMPPELAFPTYGERDTTFRLIVVAGPVERPLHAIAAIDSVITALEAEQFPLKSAQPARFGLAGSGTLPAYEITLHSL